MMTTMNVTVIASGILFGSSQNEGNSEILIAIEKITPHRSNVVSSNMKYQPP